MSNRDGWRRVTRRAPCPICGKPDNCSVTDDEAFAICGRVADGSIKDYGNSWLHVLRERERNNWRPVSQAPKPQIPETPLAPIERRHAVYTALLESLTLSGRHSDDLLRRGLHDTSIAYNLFATVPSRLVADAIAARLAARFDLRGVPGFHGGGEDEFEAYLQRGWQLNISDWHAGYIVPTRDLSGRIQALQVRRDEGTPRYCWLSSVNKPGGVTSGAPLHFAAPHRLESGSAIITEGALKSEVIAQFTSAAVVGLAGVGNFKTGLGDALKSLGVRRVQIAYDADWCDKPNVRHELKKLGRMLGNAGLAVSVLSWDVNKGKGLDDLLLGEVA